VNLVCSLHFLLISERKAYDAVLDEAKQSLLKKLELDKNKKKKPKKVKAAAVPAPCQFSFFRVICPSNSFCS